MKQREKIMKLPLITLVGTVMFPGCFSSHNISGKSMLALKEAFKNKNGLVFITSQKTLKYDFSVEDDLFEVGTICSVERVNVEKINSRAGDTKVIIKGESRGRIKKFHNKERFWEVTVEELEEIPFDDREEEIRNLSEQILNELKKFKVVSSTNKETIEYLKRFTLKPFIFEFSIANIASMPFSLLQEKLLEESDIEQRLRNLLSYLKDEKLHEETLDELDFKLQKQIEKDQREYFLREKIKVLRKELGEENKFFDEIDDFKAKLDSLELSDVVRKKLEKEISRYSRMPSTSAESIVARSYIELFLDLPWNKSTVDNDDINKSIEILENEHFGLDDVKERIVEFLAVRKLSKNMKAPIICLLGPPGVGKTSIAKSIANAMNRKFVRVSLGGVRDEAEIRGHRRTYVGSIPGRIINAINEIGSNNPVFLFDEIDKMTYDFRGDPASAMLEVLDPEQNKDFVDHYLEVPFDLSKVVFITTANSLSGIPRPLLDRMDIIQISGYTDLEKLEIAKRYLIGKQEIENGLKKGFLKFDDDVLKYLINNYTRESGVRTLERQLGKIARKIAVKTLKNPKLKYQKVTKKLLREYLGVEIKRSETEIKGSRIGETTGLAWTQSGGETLNIEVSIVNGTGKIELTGKLGDVMKESARTAMTYIRTIAGDYEIDEEFYRKKDIHIHIPEGAIPKDGPSAGITLATSILSSLSEIPVKANLAMTGEITLRGRVLPVGGIKEKVLAAYRVGITNVILPFDNKLDYEEIPSEVKDKIKSTFVKEMKEVLNVALDRKAK